MTKKVCRSYNLNTETIKRIETMFFFYRTSDGRSFTRSEILDMAVEELFRIFHDAADGKTSEKILSNHLDSLMPSDPGAVRRIMHSTEISAEDGSGTACGGPGAVG